MAADQEPFTEITCHIRRLRMPDPEPPSPLSLKQRICLWLLLICSVAWLAVFVLAALGII
jgi:hypothetical protein